MQVVEYTSKPRTVKAVLVTAENIGEVAQWCKGEIEGEGAAAFIKVKAHRPQNQRQTEGHIGDYIVQQGKNFKVYLPAAFLAGYDPKPKYQHIPYAPAVPKEPTPVFDELVGKQGLVGVPKEPVSKYEEIRIDDDGVELSHLD